MILLKDSETKINLMRAFAGESQARNRYIFAAEAAMKANMYVLSEVFKFTAKQEEAHAKVFFDHLKAGQCENVEIDAVYPVDLGEDILGFLKNAHQNEFEEHDVVYKAFAEKAAAEGFAQIAESFKKIAMIEKVHGERFLVFHNQLSEKKLFASSHDNNWMCLHCGYVLNAGEAPPKCPVCSHDRGFYVRANLAPYTCDTKMIE